MFIGNIKHDATITKIKLSCDSFAPHYADFLSWWFQSSISTARKTARNWTASLKFHVLVLPLKLRCHGKAFCSLTQCIPSSCTSLCFQVFLLHYSTGLLCHSSDPSPGIFFICKQVGRKILGAKTEIVNCLLVVRTRKWRFKIVFRKLNCCTASGAA